MNALELLEHDHQKVKALFEQGQQIEDKKQQKQIFKEIKSELETHARIEETIFYPALNRAAQLAKALAEAGMTPLEYMLYVMRDPNVCPERRDEMAKAAAPYLHAR